MSTAFVIILAITALLIVRTISYAVIRSEDFGCVAELAIVAAPLLIGGYIIFGGTGSGDSVPPTTTVTMTTTPAR